MSATLVTTTIATLASQTSFTLTAGPPDDGALDNCLAVFTDASDSTQKCFGFVDSYVASTKTVTLIADPGVFTLQATDNVEIIAPFAAGIELVRGVEVTTTTIPTASENATAVWSAVGRTLTSGPKDAEINAILNDTDITIPALLSAITTLLNAIKAKSDLLPAQPAAVGSTMQIDMTQTTPGGNSTGEQLDKAGSGGDSGGWLGNGPYSITVTVRDEDTNPLQNAQVRLTEGVEVFSGLTDVSGTVTFSLNGGTYGVTISKAGYTYTPTSKTVTADDNGTLTEPQIMIQTVSISAPDDPQLCRVYGFSKDLAGVLKAGVQVGFRLSRHPAQAGVIVDSTPISVTTDSNGYFQADLIRSDVMTPARTYVVKSTALGLRDVEISLTSATLDLSSII